MKDYCTNMSFLRHCTRMESVNLMIIQSLKRSEIGTEIGNEMGRKWCRAIDWKTCGMKCDMLLCSMLIEFVKNKSPYVWHGYVYAVSMFCSSVLGVLCSHHHYNFAYTTGLRVRTALTSAIYRKVQIDSPQDTISYWCLYVS